MHHSPRMHKEPRKSLMRLKSGDFIAPAYQLKSISTASSAGAPSLDSEIVIISYLGADILNLN